MVAPPCVARFARDLRKRAETLDCPNKADARTDSTKKQTPSDITSQATAKTAIVPNRNLR
ncbi:hypothetical protein CKA38_10720 [Ereboglobus luteus]|uniref:Uncharacterized protein n=1 Tax=Ereboglobus luteus TaxID=1796921 RepID=A0A2U8E4B8_9BACT|nr:hypothetical protein CKA38_10720 [Ereboglobus luteus]